jgi:hypothetical protein
MRQWRAPVARKSGRTISGDCRDCPSPTRHFSHAIVGCVGDVEVARRIDHHSFGEVERCAGGGSSVPGESRSSASGDSCDRTTSRNFPDPAVEMVRDINVCRRVDGYFFGTGQRCARSGAAVAGEAIVSISSNRRDRPAGHLSDAVVVKIRHVQVAPQIDNHARGTIEGCSGARSSVTREQERQDVLLLEL